MKDYYQIIGVERTASEAEIKRSFRKLAVQYHPDKNPSQEAEAIFKEINEAYEILSDPESKVRYDQLLAPISQPTWQPTYTRAQARTKGPSERQILMQSMLRFSQLLFYIGCLWSAVLVVDFVIPGKVLEEKVISDATDMQYLFKQKHHDLLVTENGHHFPLSATDLVYFPRDWNLKIHTSFIFSALIKVENYNSTFEVNNLATIYRNFSFAPILLLLCCAVGIVWQRGVEFHVNLGIVVFLLMILNMIFLFKSVV